ncbi:MAG: hypothetical protein NT126_10930, partial [Bacteroidetes bacterium]|nr:hypothetical protein [Bacteroidota bacterium]
MKQPTNHTILNRIAVLSIAALFLMNVSTAQEAKTFSSIQLSFYKNPDQSRTVIANVMQKDKKGGMMVYGKNVKINFYLEQSSGETLMGSAMTAVNGKAVYVLPADVASDETGKTSVTAKLENNELLADAESEASVKNAKLMMTLSEKDTLRQMTVKASELLRDGTEKPLPNMEV